jgi:uncharacterized membrane-anchored protein
MLFTVGVNAQAIDDAQDQAASVDEAQALIDFWQAMDQAQGTIRIDAANVVLDVPDNYIFLNAKDAESVLVDAWGNMPGSNVLGMLMPAGVTPFDSNAWAVTIEYQEDGYVSDEEAEEIDYSELLSEMQADTLEASKNRVEQGYETIELIGWASQPYYDKQAHKLHWAKELKFGDYEQNTLNYDIRVLGRRGVLVLSFIAGMEQKAEIDAVLPEVLEIANFETGNQYADFNPDTDNYAAYGLGALITGKVLAKTGFLAMLVIFLKKFGVFIVIGIGALLKGLFSRKSKQENKD